MGVVRGPRHSLGTQQAATREVPTRTPRTPHHCSHQHDHPWPTLQATQHVDAMPTLHHSRARRIRGRSTRQVATGHAQSDAPEYLQRGGGKRATEWCVAPDAPSTHPQHAAVTSPDWCPFGTVTHSSAAQAAVPHVPRTCPKHFGSLEFGKTQTRATRQRFPDALPPTVGAPTTSPRFGRLVTRGTHRASQVVTRLFILFVFTHRASRPGRDSHSNPQR